MLNKQDVRRLLEERFALDIHKKMCEIPIPADLKDSYKAAFRIKEAIDSGELIAVVGDYDVDGIVSSVIVSEFFDAVGANYVVKIPNRFTDGYGLNPQIVEELKDAKLIVTVDNGISANEAAIICKKLGIDLIITDHHMPPPTLPDAYAIVNPKCDGCTFPKVEICGAEVAWYLVGALKDICQVKFDMASFLDILIIAIIADMMELRDLNRVLLKAGIKRLNSTPRPCFRSIREFYGKREFVFDDIGFLIAPLINSAGRMDDATISYKFLKSKNIREANGYLDMIEGFNRSRKAEEKMLYEISLKDISQDDEIIVVSGNQWHEGVIGIVASRLAKHFKKPAIVFSVEHDHAKGSARSVGKFDILSVIATQKDKLISFGGHKGAAGLVIKPELIDEFKQAVNSSKSIDSLHKHRRGEDMLGVLNFDAIDLEMLEILEFYEPYGQKNPRPLFELHDITVKSTRFIGRDKQHLKLVFQRGESLCEGLYFNARSVPNSGDSISIAFTLTKNSFKGQVTPEIIISEILSE